MTPFEQGKLAAEIAIGIQKNAGFNPSIASKIPALTRVKRWGTKKLPGFKKGLKDAVVGDYGRAKNEFLEGGLKRMWRKGDPKKRISPGIIRESVAAPDVLTKALFYGMPAVEAGQIALDDKENKGKRIGETAGSALLGAAAWKPFGMLGSMAVDPIGRGLGGSIGSLGDKGVNLVRGNSQLPE